MIAALCIFILGEVVLGVGLLSGGSPERVWDKVNERYPIAAGVDMWNQSVESGMLGAISDLLSIDLPTFDLVEETPEPTATPEPTETPAPAETPVPSVEPAETEAP